MLASRRSARSFKYFAAARPLCTSPNESDLLSSLQRHHKEACSREVKWFTEQMPATYFRQVAPATQEHHLRTIIALASERIATPEVKLVDKTADGQGKEVTFLSEGQSDGGMKTLARQLFEDVKPGSELRKVGLFSSKDDRISINLFEVAEAEEARFNTNAASADPAEAAASEALAAYRAELQAGKYTGAGGEHARPSRTILSEAELTAFLSRASSRYVTTLPPRLLFRQFGLCALILLAYTPGLGPSGAHSHPSHTYFMFVGHHPYLFPRLFYPFARSALPIFLAWSDATLTSPLSRSFRLHRRPLTAPAHPTSTPRLSDQAVAGGDASAVEIERNFDGEMGNHLMMVALPGVYPRQALWRTLSVLRQHNVHILRAQVRAPPKACGVEGVRRQRREAPKPWSARRTRVQPRTCVYAWKDFCRPRAALQLPLPQLHAYTHHHCHVRDSLTRPCTLSSHALALRSMQSAGRRPTQSQSPSSAPSSPAAPMARAHPLASTGSSSKPTPQRSNGSRTPR